MVKAQTDGRAGKMKWFDMQLIKLAIVVAVLLVISLFSSDVLSEITSLWWLWLILLIVFLIKPVYKYFKK